MKAPLLALVLAAAALPARAETIEVSDDHGGSVAQYDAQWADDALPIGWTRYDHP